MLVLLTATVGRLVERPRLGPSTRARTDWAHGVTVVVGLLVLYNCCALNLKPEPFYPAADLAGPLPAGLTAVEGDVRDAGSCGTGLCSYTLTVTARPGQSGSDLYNELSGHLQTGCRPTGWLIDRRTACVRLTRPTGNTVGIHLEGSRERFDGGKSRPG